MAKGSKTKTTMSAYRGKHRRRYQTKGRKARKLSGLEKKVVMESAVTRMQKRGYGR